MTGRFRNPGRRTNLPSAGMFRHILIAVLFCPPCIAFAQDDPAYVDGPVGKSVNDPARADGGGGGTGTLIGIAPASFREGGNTSDSDMMQLIAQMAAMQKQGQEQAIAQEQMLGATQNGIGAQGGYNSMYSDGDDSGYNQAPNMQGYGMPQGDGQIQPSPSPAQQIRSGLMQDAGGIIDAGINRKIYGPNGPVITTPPAPSGW